MAQSQSLSTEDIQKLLEENYIFIKAIVDQQNLGRLPQMQEYQTKLQQNLMLLAAVADAHPTGTGTPAGAAAPAAALQAPAAQRPAPLGTNDGNNAPRPGPLQAPQAPMLFLGGGLPPGQQFNVFGGAAGPT